MLITSLTNKAELLYFAFCSRLLHVRHVVGINNMAETMLKKHVPIEKKADNVTENGASSKPVSSSQQENKEPHKKTEKMSVKSANTSKTATTGAAGSRETNDINKEIGLILKELNSNVLQQGEQIKKLSDRVDFLYDDSNYDPYYENYDDEYEGTNCLEHTSPHCDENDSEDCPPSKKTKTTFKGLSDKFLLAEKVDNEVNEDLAQFVNSSFRSGVSDERVAEITKDVYRPNNCDSLTKTRVNPGIWRLLKPQTQTDDAKMQAIQNLMIKASINFVKLLDKNSEHFDSESIEWGTNALALLGQCNKLVNNKRKESHKYDWDLCFIEQQREKKLKL